MDAKELAEKLDMYITHKHGSDNVVIRCSEPSVGFVASEPVKIIYPGFDWNAGLLIIEPEKPLLHKELQRDIPQPVIHIVYKNNYGGEIKPTLHCPVCERKLAKDNRYCPRCGQRVDTNEIRKRVFAKIGGIVPFFWLKRICM